MKHSRAGLADSIMLVIWVTVSAMLAWLAFSLGGVDFNVYYAAGRVTLHGGNPYEYTQLAKEITSVTEINNPYYYAPWFTWSILPLSLLPFPVARLLWACSNFALWFLALFSLQGLVDWPPPGWRRWGMYLFVTVLFAWSTWGFEQVGILIFFLFTLALQAVEKKKWTAGIWLSLLLFKPNITALPILVICLWLIRNRNWRPVLVAAVTTIAVLAVSVAVSPGWYNALLTPDKLAGLSFKFSESGAISMLRHNTTLKDWLTAYHASASVSTILPWIATVFGLLFLSWRIVKPVPFIQTTMEALVVTFAITPYALYYDYPSLTLALFFANRKSHSNPLLTLIQIGLNMAIIASLFVGTTISYRYWTVILIAVLMAFQHVAEGFDVASSNSAVPTF